MLQFPAFMQQYPSSMLMPSSVILPSQWPDPHNDDIFLPLEESELDDKWNEIRKANNNLVVIGKTSPDYKEDYDAEADEDDGDNVEESEGDELEQETG
ncbi:hypothetical protein QJS04_geneDACA014850 [Acorus gramineus]|uniref:Anaphase-promoting complex subunit 15 n=2 Tax=Acorus TaxID=4464 RepID=A0AAV9CMP6_ACOCL|nr:hypothetical protein QJS04_geneDACA014850 [Acorus gramineus]KAK1289669.1 hypothetical protein QJS10_CPB18g00656 [Acorus calamus]